MDPAPALPPHDPTRRAFLQTSAMLGAAAAWLPVFRVVPGESTAHAGGGSTGCPEPPNFPAGIQAFKQAYRNWSGEIQIDAIWTATAATPQDVVTLANWAHANNWRIRARGMAHGWSPIGVDPDATCDTPMLLVDTTAHLTAVSVDTAASPPTVTAQTGIDLLSLHTALQAAGLGLTNCPAPGALSLGGALTVNGHGTSVPAAGEQLLPGHTFGSMSNLLRSVTAVVWDATQQAYVLRTFQRSDPEMGALCVHLGRAFLVEVTLQVGANSRLRCESYRSVSAADLFAAPGSGSNGRTFSDFLDQSGRVETIQYPFTDNPWLKVWTVTPEEPLLSREVSEPYNYPFSDNIPVQVSDILQQIVNGNVGLAPAFGATMALITDGGLTATLAWDLWGWSKDVQLYIKPTTLRVAECGFAVSCSRADLQRVLSEFHQQYLAMQQAYRDRGEYPANCPVEIRVTGMDRPEDCLVPGARVPLLSASRPWPTHPEWDCVIFFNILSVPGTPVAPRYYAELEEWFYANYASYAGVRVEWSKGWAYTDAGAYTNEETLGTRIPASFTQGMPADADFRAAVDMLDRMDPHRVFSTKFLDRLMPRSADLNADGTVNGADLADLLAGWGPKTATNASADLNADGVVDGFDLARLLARWGTKG
jgi:FAD/FMN-containing dehydrogenase